MSDQYLYYFSNISKFISLFTTAQKNASLSATAFFKDMPDFYSPGVDVGFKVWVHQIPIVLAHTLYMC